MTTLKNHILAALALGITQLHANPAPGLGNLTYDPSELFTATKIPLAIFNKKLGIAEGTGRIHMVGGYMLVPFASDGAGDGIHGGFALINFSNPRSLSTAFTTHDNPSYRTPSSPDYAGGLGEPHAFSISGNIVCLPINRPGGLEFWDFSDMGDGTPAHPPKPKKISRLLLPGVENSGYFHAVFSATWQGDYVYVAGTGLGLYIVDASDPARPVLLDRGPGYPNPIPLSQTGNFPIGFATAVGNLLVLSRTDNGMGLATLDISDPANPALLYSSTTDNTAYSTIVNGSRIYGSNGRMWDITNPAAPSFIAEPDITGLDKGGYATIQDNFVHIGMSIGYIKADISGTTSVTVGSVKPGIVGADYDFATTAGNLIIIGDDHNRGTPIYPHQLAPDTTGPAVNMVVPANGALNQALTSRIGFTLTDQVEPSSVNASTIIVRLLGTQTQLEGTYTVQTPGMVNFWPAKPLQPGSSYEIIVPAGGIRDWAGNPSDTTFTSQFSTGDAVGSPIILHVANGGRSIPGENWQAEATASHPTEAIELSWAFGDGSPDTAFSASTSANHTYNAPGHYIVTVTARLVSNHNITRITSFTHTVHRPIVGTPRSSSTILLDATRDHIWAVNRDNDTVTRIDATSLAKLSETRVGDEPVSIAQVQNGHLWVLHRTGREIRVMDPATAAVIATHSLPYASMPGGIVASLSGDTVFVSLEATGQLVEISTATGQILRTLAVGSTPRGLGLSPDGKRLFVSRFISPDDAGKITEIDAAAFTVLKTIDLAIETTPDSENSGRGLPNYLGAPAVTPDNTRLWIPSKKDNIQRGPLRDGRNLTFESTVRPIISVVDLASSREIPAARVDLNDRATPVAVTHTAIGDYSFALLQGSAAIDVIDAYKGNVVTSIDLFGKAPDGLLIDTARRRLIVHNFMSRSVSVYDISTILDSTAFSYTHINTISTVAKEELNRKVLLGKQLFYDAKDRRLTRDSYMSCATCHDDGGQDGRVWDMTGLGEGLRNTIALNGRQGTAGHGRAHWSGNFDEIHDFENQIRALNDGTGLMVDDDFNAGTREQPLGDLKTGVSADLDALAAYLESLNTFAPSPHRQPNGTMTAAALAGQAHFKALNCITCHNGDGFTDSRLGLRHDIGTLKSSSGKRLGATLDGIDTPTLRDIWKTPPYLHDGSAATLEDVFTSAATGTAHGVAQTLAPAAFSELIAYLQQIDGTNPGFPETDAPTLTGFAPGNGATGVSNRSSLILVFNERIRLFTGTLAIHRTSDNSLVESFDLATSPRITRNVGSLIIQPTQALPFNTDVYVTIAPGIIKDAQGNAFAGLADPTAWRFTVAPNQAPTFNTLLAVVTATGHNSEAQIVMGNLNYQGDEADVDGKVTAYVVKSVATGTLKLGTNALTATSYAVGTNDVIDADIRAFWTPAPGAQGTDIPAFNVVARDDASAESTPPVTVTVSVAPARILETK